MSAADDAREELEAILWRLRVVPGQVDKVLAAADVYAGACAEAADACAGARAEAAAEARYEQLLERRRQAYRAAERGELMPCGTAAAARRHRRREEPLDEACHAAEAQKQREMYRRHKTRTSEAAA